MRIGEVDVHPIADGTFRAGPSYFGDHFTAHGHEDYFNRDGKAWLPIGCFLIRTGARTILVDAGMGPIIRDDAERRLLVGGQLLLGLRAVGVTADDIDAIVCTHLHADHCGWLFDAFGRPTFGNADIWFGGADWHHFVLNSDTWMFDHMRYGLRNADPARLHLIDHDITMSPGIDLTMTPGHTPGHLSVIVSSGIHRALLLGDAILCPLELDEPTWQSIADVDPQLAAQAGNDYSANLRASTPTGRAPTSPGCNSVAS